jgi:cytochrome c553
LDFEHSFANHADLTSGAALDSQGRKGVPHACLSCHGGHYDAMSKQVIGASLLPVVPARLQFGQGARSKEEESIRRINQIILQSNPAPGIVDLINAMYNGAPNTPGATANDAAVPSGWSSQPGLYRQVVLPYCASCHSAQRGPVNFRSWGNMQQNKNAVQRSVCQDFTMPHSEVLFRRFWTEGGGVSLPGLLSTSLGFPTCRQ